MVQQNGKMNEPDNVLRGEFGKPGLKSNSQASSQTLKGPSSDEIIGTATQAPHSTSSPQSLPTAAFRPDRQKVSKELFTEVTAKQLQTPDTVDGLYRDSMKFLRDLGWTPQTDINKTGDRVADSVALRKRIDYLRGQLQCEIGELKNRSAKYVHIAQGAAHYAQDAERFFEKHPNLLKLLKLATPK